MLLHTQGFKCSSELADARKRKKGHNGEVVDVEEPEPEVETGNVPIFQQPEPITGAKLKPYQLEGLQWMVSLDQNGILGIQADELRLGKVFSVCLFRS